MLTGPEKFRPGIPGFAEFADGNTGVALSASELTSGSLDANEETIIEDGVDWWVGFYSTSTANSED